MIYFRIIRISAHTFAKTALGKGNFQSTNNGFIIGKGKTDIKQWSSFCGVL